MPETKDGGTAFPQAGWKYLPETGRYVESISGGMTLRDWFAGQAVTGISAGYWGNPEMSGLSPLNLAHEAPAPKGVSALVSLVFWKMVGARRFELPTYGTQNRTNALKAIGLSVKYC
jgi:hypothetical protein